MFNKLTNALSKGKAAILAFVLAIAGGLFAFGSSVSAAVDPDVASTSGLVVDTLKENITSVITTNIAKIVIVGVIIFSIFFVWKLARRFMK